VAARKEVVSVVVWVLIVVAGVLMLKLSGFHRVLIILAAALVGGVLHLFLPLLVNRVLRVGVFAGVLILLLWAAQWWFSRLPELWQRRTAKRQKALQKKRERKGRKQQKEGTAQEPRVPDKEQ
ncbi:MAG: hypothetical protein PVJ86_01185, partial [Phycisphaerales bacterium]